MQGALDDTFHLLSHSEILRRGVQAFFSLEPVEDGGGTIAGLTNAVCIMSVYSRTTNDYWKPVLPRTSASDAYGWVTEYPPISRLKREQKEGRLKSNLLPYDYSPGARYDLSRPFPPELEDRYVCNSDILMKSKRALASWIWDACNVVLDHVLLDGAIPRCPDDLTAVREDAMERAVAFIDSQRKLYARRPEEPLGPSSSKALLWLRRILEQAPLAPVPGSALWGAPFPGLDFVRAEEERYSYYDWNEAYLERVFTAACEVVEELGAGRDGWRTVRWEVYDKYSI
ncbi:hypothetical protein GSI_02793 [Ganoderma sinense ZZ0214-1]|uniref:Uncharacterized protein n=1 Tax=Ganoderma sinense ZZ0214-1 TaxID=1077348 RepID=A0A2G8SML3_9APHY|nr:hypothetical protein GSI_02793 [Ganoderma sinense ZZ0214-1]